MASDQLTFKNTVGDDDETDKAATALGLCLEEPAGDAPPDTFYLWPESEPVWKLWHKLQTLWRTGMTGQREGLDYTGVLAYLKDVARIKPKKLNEVFGCIQAMELASLVEWIRQAKNKG